MAKAYSVDLRERVLADYDEGMRPVELMRRFRVARSWIYKLIAQRQRLGHVEPLKGVMGRPAKLKNHLEQLRRLVAAHPDATLTELRQKLPMTLSLTTVWRALNTLKLTLKKSHSRR